MSDKEGTGTPKGFSDDADNAILSGDPKVTSGPSKGMDSGFNDASNGDIGDDCKEVDTSESADNPKGERGMFNDNAAL